MKIVSPLFAVALAVAVLAPVIDAIECNEMCTSGCSDSTNIPSGPTSKLDIPIPSDAPTCATGQKKYIKSLTVSEQAGLGIDVTFAHAGTTFTPAVAGTKGPSSDSGTTSDKCSWVYGDVGKSGITLAGDVIATVKCSNTGAACDVKYKASYGCTPRTACATLSPDGSIALPAIASTKTATIPIPAGAPTCPYGQKRYISALTVAEDTGLGISVAFTQGTAVGAATVTPDVAKTTTKQDNGDVGSNCYFDYTDVGRASTLSDDVIATVTCPGAAACNVKYKATYACSPTVATCPSDVTTNLITRDLTNEDTNGFDVKRGSTCAAGQIDFLKSLDVRGAVNVAFNNGLTPTEVSKGSSCIYYKDVKAVKTTATDVVATVTCKSGSACAMSYKAEWDCTTPILYSRTGATGANCVADLSDCANRCAKSLQLVKASTASGGTTTTTLTFKSQFTKGCTCADLVTTVTSNAGADPVTATATDVAVTVTESANTLSIANSATNKVCTSTYSRVAFDNKFAEKSYTRTTVTPATTTPATAATDCTPADADLALSTSCPYKCAAQFTLTKPVPDAIRATQPTVAGCTCDPIEVVVGDDGTTAGNGTAALKYGFVKSGTAVNVKTTTTPSGGSAKVCDAVYKQNCDKLCTDATCKSLDVVAAGTKLTASADVCPPYTFSYPKSLVVGTLLDEGKVAVTFGSAVSALDDAPFTGTCYKKYGPIGGTPADIAANVEPTITCPGASGNVDCKVQVKPEWGCSPAKCPATFDGTPVTATLSATAASFDVKRETATCGANLFAYIKSLDVRGKDSKDIVVTFNNNLTPTPLSESTTCHYYKDVINLTPSGTDIVATLKCKTGVTDCAADFKVVWGCYSPPTADLYTRTTAVGAGCTTDPSDCANRCAKGYQLGKLEADTMFVPQFTTGCTCPRITATPPATTSRNAANSVTKMDVKFTDSDSTMTIEYNTGDTAKICTSTYKKAAFENKFVSNTYVRGATVTCTPAAPAATSCASKCAAEFTLTKPSAIVDAINATQTAVTDCECASVIAAVDGLKASGTDKSNVKYEFTTADTGVTLKTSSTDTATPPVTTTCTATYTVKPAPTPASTPAATTATPAPTPTTTAKTGTSAGVSALGAGADAGMVTVTLVAAAAGVQAVGLPA